MFNFSFFMQLDQILNTYSKARLQFSMQGFSLTAHISYPISFLPSEEYHYPISSIMASQMISCLAKRE